MTAAKSALRRALSESRLAGVLPGISRNSQKLPPYGIPLRSFPARLQSEVEALLKWKQEPYAEGRPRDGRLRGISAKDLETCITRFYGFVTNVKKRKKITQLVQLVTKDFVVAFIKWSLNERKVKGEPVRVGLGLLCATLKWNPAYKTHDFSWFRPLLSQIPPDPESDRRERKLRKYLPYEILAESPRMVRERREEIAKLGGKQLAGVVHDELLLSWLVTLAWRQRNVRECRLGDNLFKAEIPPLVNIALPRWVEEKLKVNPHEQFWQFYFREGETKTGHEVRSILPRRLVPLLEEYLELHRAVLLGGSQVSNLFLKRNGQPLAMQDLGRLVGNLTLRYAGRRITPHVIRDILAFSWLEHNPEDFLALSKMLWHRDIKTTLRIYGAKFDESHGLRRVEEWLDHRTAAPRQVTQAPIAESTELDPQRGQGQNLDYKSGYEMQREINRRLTEPTRAA